MSALGVLSLADLCKTPAAHLGQLDLATLNLLCAHGLPHSEGIDLDRIEEWLDKAAQQVELVTSRHWYRFHNSPQTYLNSPAYFRCYFLLQVLQEDFGVKYNPLRAIDKDFQNAQCLNPDFRDSRDLFIHGIIDGDGGTCCSMPVLYAAVARRLGYPLQLVEAPGHLFCRWEDADGSKFGVPEIINIEGAGYGISTHPDEYYQTWPKPWTDADRRANCYLKTLTPEQELAGFLATRAECLTDCGRTAEAIQAYLWAISLVPSDIRYRSQLDRLRNRIGESAEYTERRENVTRRLTGPKQKQRPPHGDYCQCLECQRVRGASMPAVYPGHHEGCQCIQCKEVRASLPITGAPGHAVGCYCDRCKEARESAPVKGTPGHGTGCYCAQCQAARQSKPSRVPGHPPGCQCFQCRPTFPF